MATLHSFSDFCDQGIPMMMVLVGVGVCGELSVAFPT